VLSFRIFSEVVRPLSLIVKINCVFWPINCKTSIVLLTKIKLTLALDIDSSKSIQSCQLDVVRMGAICLTAFVIVQVCNRSSQLSDECQYLFVYSINRSRYCI